MSQPIPKRIQKIKPQISNKTFNTLLVDGSNILELSSLADKKVSSEPKEGERLLRLIGKENIEALYNRLCRSSLEDQIIEDTSYGNVKTAAVTVRKEGRPTMCWLAYCVLEKEFTKRRGALFRHGLQRK